ncbi:MAG: MMPL family transporter [Acidobacteriota bacterium]
MNDPGTEKTNAPDKALVVLLRHPVVATLLLLGPLLFLAWFAQDFRIDASSNSIVLENDDDLRFYDATRESFGADDSVFVAVTPEGDLFDPETLSGLASLDRELTSIEGVRSVTSVLDVPLFESPNRGLASLADGFLTLTDDRTERDLARTELLESPLFSDALLSQDGKTTALQVVFEERSGAAELETERYRLWDLREEGTLSRDDRRRLEEVDAELRAMDAEWSRKRQEQIATLRTVIGEHASLGEIRVGGVPMIMVDIVDYIESDMLTFGIAVPAIALLVLLALFRSVKWTMLPTVVCVATVTAVLGVLGLFDRPATIVTSNFVSLLLVLTMAMLIHIIVRFRELQSQTPSASNFDLMAQSASEMARPCLYTALTTVVGFGSLYVSQIRPVMDFALIMALGIAVAYALSFLLLPALNMLAGRGPSPAPHLGVIDRPSVFTRFGVWSAGHPGVVSVSTVALLAVFALGASRLNVENRFIDYFKTDTEIHQGMVFLDDRLGGTTPLEIVLESPEEGFWIERANIDRLAALYDWLDDQPEVGKVQSIASLVDVLESAIASDPSPLVRGLQVGAPLLRMLLGRVPEELSREALRPYVSEDLATARILARVRESDTGLSRKELLGRIEARLTETPIEGVEARATGMFVLYNNMLQSLFSSQIQTIGAVFGVVWLMFLILFRSAQVATVAIVPNVLPVIVVLGALGWLGIPLDMMTIMTAAVTLGIAVDDTIHFLHRFRREVAGGHDYDVALVRSLNSIGRAMVFTSITIVVGFSTLTLSRFMPTIYFGIFTALAMIVALTAAIALLPVLLLWLRPFGEPALGKAKEPTPGAAAVQRAS